MSFNPETMSILHWCDAETQKCGYCKHQNCSISNGLWAECLTVEDYQKMIDRGWRRCGKYCYKPIMNETCCPQYTIRALEFKASKSQKKVVKKVNRFLRDGTASGGGNDAIRTEEAIRGDCQFMGIEDKAIGTMIRSDFATEMNQAGCSQPKCDNAVGESQMEIQTGSLAPMVSTTSAKTEHPILPAKVKGQAGVRPGVGADSSKPRCKKAKLLRQERKLSKQIEKGGTSGTNVQTGNKIAANANKEKSFPELLAEHSAQDRHKLKVRLISVKGATWQANKQIEFEVYKKYQIRIHGDSPEKCSLKTFERFLASSPLESTNLALGSFHQQYWLDNQLIAVGVIDILPKCVSAVYFFYDPDYNHLTLGTYSALREINFTKQLHLQHPSIKYYYMGYYIHTCTKMLYKVKFQPSDLVCPETYHWVSVDEALPKLDVQKYSRLHADPTLVDSDMCTLQRMHSLRIISRRGFIYLKDYKYARAFEEVFRTLGVILGKKLIDSVFIADLE